MAHISVHGIKLNYRFDGPEKGPVVMFSNSLASDFAMWDKQVPAFSEAGYRMLRYDSRGHGQSEAPPGPYTIETLTEDALALMDGLDLEKVHYCGLSIRDMDQRESIKAIALPTLVVAGEHDPATTVEEAELIHARIRSSVLKVVPQAAHFVNVEQAQRFNSIVLDFIGASSD